MKMLAMLSGVAVVVLTRTANRAEAQVMYGGTIRLYGYPGSAVTTYRGPLGGRVAVRCPGRFRRRHGQHERSVRWPHQCRSAGRCSGRSGSLRSG